MLAVARGDDGHQHAYLGAWPAAVLKRVAAAAQRGLSELSRLCDAEATMARLAVIGRRSLLPAAAKATLRAPAMTARGLPRQLAITLPGGPPTA